LDWTRYKALCDAPDVWSRWFIERLLELEPDTAAAALTAVLAGAPLERPPDHLGGRETDMFRVRLEPAHLTQLLASVRRAQVTGRPPPSLADRGLGGFTEALLEYQRFVAGADRSATPTAGCGGDAGAETTD
jgi:hypothetical protein